VDVTGPGEQVKAGRLVVRDAGPTDDDVLDEAVRRAVEEISAATSAAITAADTSA
jgi:hypothetical protein